METPSPIDALGRALAKQLGSSPVVPPDVARRLAFAREQAIARAQLNRSRLLAGNGQLVLTEGANWMRLILVEVLACGAAVLLASHHHPAPSIDDVDYSYHMVAENGD